uniref:Uncharacterized protein n=1 Tax=Anguilla anguilla TaxID=7936 RepID=A0A0E9XLG6_ANGAN
MYYLFYYNVRLVG